MRVSACQLFVVAFACAGAPIARAGAWLWPENHGQILLTTTFADAQKAYDRNGRLVATPPTTDLKLSFMSSMASPTG
jgi:hypothetical protein